MRTLTWKSFNQGQFDIWGGYTVDVYAWDVVTSLIVFNPESYVVQLDLSLYCVALETMLEELRIFLPPLASYQWRFRSSIGLQIGGQTDDPLDPYHAPLVNYFISGMKKLPFG